MKKIIVFKKSRLNNFIKNYSPLGMKPKITQKIRTYELHHHTKMHLKKIWDKGNKIALEVQLEGSCEKDTWTSMRFYMHEEIHS